jgi:hypothetical protein
VFREYYNHSRVHTALEGDTPAQFCRESIARQVDLGHYRWEAHCRGLVQLPIAAELRIRDPHHDPVLNNLRPGARRGGNQCLDLTSLAIPLADAYVPNAIAPWNVHAAVFSTDS